MMLNNTSYVVHNITTTPQSYIYSGGLCHLEESSSVYVYAVFLIILAVLATSENVIVLISIWRYDVLRTPSVLLLGILAFVDFITAAVVTPLKIWLTLIEVNHWMIIGSILLNFSWMFMGVVFFSLATVLMISIDRFLHVYFLEKYTLSIKKLCIGLVASWLAPIIITTCLGLKHYTLWLGWLALIYFLFCIVAMIASYIGMILSLRRHTAGITDSTVLMRSKRIEDQRRAVKTTMIIIIACIAMNLPPILSIVLGFMGMSNATLCAITFFALLGNSFVNPIIYCSRVPVIKRHILDLLHITKFQDHHEVESEDYLTVVAEGV